MNLSLNKLYARRAKYVVWKVVEDNGILLKLQDGSYFEVNPVGLAIWEACDGQTSHAEVFRMVAADFGVDPKVVTRDGLPFLRQLRRRGLIQVLKSPSRSPAPLPAPR